MPDDEPGAALPDHELTTFLMSVAEAADLARAGETVSGFRCLEGGMHRARLAAEDGEPWGPELVLRYQRTLNDYMEQHGGKLLERVSTRIDGRLLCTPHLPAVPQPPK